MTSPCYKTLKVSFFGGVGIVAEEMEGLQKVTRVFSWRNLGQWSPELRVRLLEEDQERNYKLVLSQLLESFFSWRYSA